MINRLRWAVRLPGRARQALVRAGFLGVPGLRRQERELAAWLRAQPPAAAAPDLHLYLQVCPGQVPDALLTLRSLQAGTAPAGLHISAAPAEQQALQAALPGGLQVTWRAEPPAAQHLPGSGYAALLAPGDVLHPLTLAAVGRALAATPCDLLYTDCAHWRGQRAAPWFKPGWSPDLLLAWNYPGRLAFFALQRLAQLPNLTFDLASAHALALALLAAPPRVQRLPYVLITCPPEPPLCDLPAVQQAAAPCSLQALPNGLCRVHVQPAGQPLVSIIICARDQAELTARCLDAIFTRTAYPHFEVLLVDNGSTQPAALDLYHSWAEKEPRFHCERMDLPFNFSLLNNRAGALARGQVLVFLNNDTEVFTPEWLQELAGQALRPASGACAPLLLFPDGSIQHAGILAGRGRVRHAWYRAATGQAGHLGRLLVPSNFTALSAACLAVERGRFLAVGGFDEALAIAYNDVDLCLKLTDKGYFNLLLPHIRILHHESASRGYEISSARRARRQAEFDLLLRRWPGLAVPDPFAHPCLADLSGDFYPYG